MTPWVKSGSTPVLERRGTIRTFITIVEVCIRFSDRVFHVSGREEPEHSLEVMESTKSTTVSGPTWTETEHLLDFGGSVQKRVSV